ncbi:amino acid adenylation domain-containing protein [Streptomyces sp. NPDC058818]|uniref:non-ribosomal peptide synthetase n=1 Tax=Streptomyces sp. NPDC058818 TaxID=3346640 RepID=UPI0036831FD7
MNQPVPSDDILARVIDCTAEVLGTSPGEVAPTTPLAALGLESFTAVRLRRRIRERTGCDLPLTAFLGDSATVRAVADRVLADRAPEDVPPSGAPGPEAAPGAREHGGGDFPLTPIQASYLAGRAEGLPLGGVATFYYYEYDRTPGDTDPLVDVARLETAWNRLITHHPMLRMTVDDRGRQHILEAPGPYRIGVTDVRHERAERVRETLSAQRLERSHQNRPTGSWPLFDLHATLLPDGRTRLHVGVDVLLTDLAGWMLLMRQWGRLVDDPAHRLPEPRARFADLQRARVTDPEWAARRARDHAYWAERAPGLPPAPRLPLLRDLADTTPPRFVRSAAELDAGTWAALRARCTEHAVTPTAALLAAFAVVLGRWGAGEQLCLNTTLFDRPEDEAGAEGVVGDFTTTALVGTPPFDPAGWKGFADYATAVNHRFWEDLDHRSVSGVEVIRELRTHTSPTVGAPSHPVVFTSGVGLAGDGEAPAAWIGREVHGISQTPQVLLDHIVWDEGGRLRLAWDSVEGAFPDGWIQVLLDAYVRLLRTLTDADAWRDIALGWDPSFHPEEPLDTTPFPTAGPLLHDPAADAARRHPRRPALRTSTTTVSHARLADNAAATAALLAAHGVGPGDMVAVACEKGAAQITAVLGVSLSGAGYLPVEPTWPAARIAAVCERAGVRHALTGRGVRTDWPDTVTVHRLTAAGRPARGATAPAEPAATLAVPRPDDLAYTIFTSGSTGSPKGVEIQHRAARTTVDDIVDRFAIGPEDRVLALSALSFDLSVFDIYGVLGAGGCLVLPEPARQRDPQHWLEQAGRHGITVWNTAPALLEMLVEYAEMEPEAAATALRTLRLVMLSGDWIPLSLPDRLRRLAPQAKVMSLGGATEASIWSITHPVEHTDPGWRSIPYGRALRAQSFFVLDENGGPCPVGEAGELFIGGDGLARGYTGDPAQTAERFAVHPVLGRRLYRTGDLGRWTADGTIEFLGRVDRQVKIRGHRIELGEVEAVLARHPAVRQCVVSSVRGPDGRPRLVAHLSPRGASEPPTAEELADALRERLPDYMVPSRFVILDQLPVTANGKIDHAALTAPAGPVAAAGADALAAGADALRAGSGVSTASAGVPAAGTGSEPPGAGLSAADTGVPTADADGPAAVAVERNDIRAHSGPAPAGEEAVSVGRSPVDGQWAVAAVAEAAALGLEVAVVIRPGGLRADQALEASARWLRTVARATGSAPVQARLPADGLAEVVCPPDGRKSTAPAPDAGPALPSDVSRPDGDADGRTPSHGRRTATPAPDASTGDRTPSHGDEMTGDGTPSHGGDLVGERAPSHRRRTATPAPVDPAVWEALTAVLADFTDSPVTPESTFAALGATSLTLVLTHRRLREGIAPGLALADMFEHPTVAALAARITARRATDTAEPAGGDGTGAVRPPTSPQSERPARRSSRLAARALAEETTR